jgi:hypothetical protein
MAEFVSGGIHGRTLFLFNDIYLIVKARKKFFKFIEYGDLTKATLSDSGEVEGKPAFVFSCGKDKTHTFLAVTFDDKRNFMREIQDLKMKASKKTTDVRLTSNKESESVMKRPTPFSIVIRHDDKLLGLKIESGEGKVEEEQVKEKIVEDENDVKKQVLTLKDELAKVKLELENERKLRTQYEQVRHHSLS